MGKFFRWAEPLLALRGQPASEERLRRLTDLNVNRNRLKRNTGVSEDIKWLKDHFDAVRAAVAYECFLPQRELVEQALERAGAIYSETKRARSALDFQDLEQFAIRLLESDAQARKAIQSRFHSILMDEMQDTNPLQWRLVELVRSPDCFFAVGDVNQSIYGFRHAEPQVFAEYSERLRQGGRAVDRLPQNYRSRPEILAAVEAVCAGLPGIQDLGLRARRAFQPKDVPSVEVIAVSGEKGEDLVRKEAAWVARRIRELVGKLTIQYRADGEERERLIEFSDVAILIRKGGPMERFEAVLENFGVPCLVARGANFFETPEVTDLLGLLRVIDNPRGEISMAAVLRSPLVGVSDETLLLLKTAGNLADGLAAHGELDIAAGDAERLDLFRRQLAEMREQAGYVSPDRLLARVIDEVDYLGGASARVRANVDKFLSLVRDAWVDQALPLRELLENLDALRDAESEPEAPPPDSVNAVRLLTIHQAKGLEFPVVFVAHAHTGVSQRQDDLVYSREFGLGVRWRLPDGVRSAADHVHQAIAAREKERSAEEAHRLLFVAMTRAEQHLVVSYSVRGTPQSDWPKAIQDGWGFTPAFDENQAVIHQPEGLPFAVRLLCASSEALPIEEERAMAEVESVAVLPRPKRAGQYDSAASVTALALFQDCPRRWLLERSLGFEAAQEVGRGEGEDGSSSVQLGAEVHRLLAGGNYGDASARARELASRFESSALAARARAAVRCGREDPLLVALEDVVLSGQIDLWFEEQDGKLVVVDYKTGKLDAPGAGERLESYRLQLRLYAAALTRRERKPVKEAWLYFLGDEIPEPVPLGGEDELSRVVRGFREAQEKLDFPVRPGARCQWCGFYQSLCPAL
jgi:ATP-dependent exoDNAse (exonuclease V) beta subunit